MERRLKLKRLVGPFILAMLMVVLNGCGIITETNLINVIPVIDVQIDENSVAENGVIIYDSQSSTIDVYVRLATKGTTEPGVSGTVVLYVNGAQYGPREISAGGTVNFRIPLNPGKIDIKAQFHPYQREVSVTALWRKKVYNIESHPSSFTFYSVYVKSIGVENRTLECGRSYPILFNVLGDYDSVKIEPDYLSVPENYSGTFSRIVTIKVYKGAYMDSKEYNLSYEVTCKPRYTIEWIGLEDRNLKAVEPGKRYEVKYYIYGEYDSVRVEPAAITVPSDYSNDYFSAKIKVYVYRGGEKDAVQRRLRYRVRRRIIPVVSCAFNVNATHYSFVNSSGKSVYIKAPSYKENNVNYHLSVMPGVPFRLNIKGKSGWVPEIKDTNYREGITSPETLSVKFYKKGVSWQTCKATIYIDPISAIDLDYILYTYNVNSFKICASGEEIPFTAERYVFIDMGKYGKYEVESGGIVRKEIDGCIYVRLEKWR